MGLSTLSQIYSMQAQTTTNRAKLVDDTKQIASGERATKYSESPDSKKLVDAESRHSWASNEIRLSELKDLKLSDAEAAIQSVIETSIALRADAVGANNDAKPDNESLPRVAQSTLAEIMRQLNTRHNGAYIFGGTKVDAPPVKTPEYHTLTGTRIIPGADDTTRDTQPFTGTGLLNVKIRDTNAHTTIADVSLNLTDPPSGITTMGELRTALQGVVTGAGIGGFTVDYIAVGALQLNSGSTSLGIILGTGEPTSTITGTDVIPGADEGAKDAQPYNGPANLKVTVKDQDANALLHEVDVDLSTVTTMGDLRSTVDAAMTPLAPNFSTYYDAAGHLEISTGEPDKLLILGSTVPTPIENSTSLDFENYFELPKIEYYEGNDVTDLVTAHHPGFEKVLRGTLMLANAPTAQWESLTMTGWGKPST